MYFSLDPGILLVLRFRKEETQGPNFATERDSLKFWDRGWKF